MTDLLTDLVALAVPLADRQQQPLGCVHAGMLEAGDGDGGDVVLKGDVVFEGRFDLKGETGCFRGTFYCLTFRMGKRALRGFGLQWTGGQSWSFFRFFFASDGGLALTRTLSQEHPGRGSKHVGRGP